MRRRIDPRLWWLLAGAAGASLAWLAVTIGLIAATLEPDARARMLDLLGDRWGFVLLMWLAGMAAIATGLQRAFEVGVHPWRRLAEEAQVLLSADGAPALRERGPADVRRVAQLFNRLVAQRDDWRRQMDDRVRTAARDIELERSRLAALMSELTQSVVVCNLDGRVLLYNNRARLQFRALSQTPTLAGGAELIGLGRSIYTVFDRALIAHALENVRHRLRRGAPHPSAQFVTATRGGQLLRVQVTPVRQADPDATEGADSAAMAGYVLVLDNITREHEQAAMRERLWLDLTQGNRNALASAQAALEVMDLPDVEAPMRARLHRIVHDEVRRLADQLQRAAQEGGSLWTSEWTREDMLGAELVAAIARRLSGDAGLAVTVGDLDATLWLRIDSFSLIQAFGYLAHRLHADAGVTAATLRLRSAPTADGQGARAHLDLAWQGGEAAGDGSAYWQGWEQQPMRTGESGLAATVRDVVERHDGALWVERDAASGESCFRLLLPAVEPAEPLQAAPFVRTESRPEFYDFDLFRRSPAVQAYDDVPLTALAYTVFDTETTGLNPSEGDEIIQIGATRIVNGKLLRHESFEQLVDPRRSIPAHTIPIHGVTPEMVAGQPDITQVLPAFHTFARDTVLVAHNAAFDMRFLQLKEKVTGLSFDQPVLDTLLLSAVVHPAQPSHRLEEIAERFGIPVIGRHTALGDAFVTAEVLLRLIPLLQQQGIVTLGQALQAAERTYYARLTY